MGYANRAAAYREEPAVRQETEEFQLVLANPERYEDAAASPGISTPAIRWCSTWRA